MNKYMTRLVKIPYHIFNSTVTEKELISLDDTINKYAELGWELVTYTYLGGNNEVERGLLMTFKKKDSEPVV